jgi:hypothetical protein
MDRHSHSTSWLHSYNLSVDEFTLRIGTDKKNLILDEQDAEKKPSASFSAHRNPQRGLGRLTDWAARIDVVLLIRRIVRP